MIFEFRTYRASDATVDRLHRRFAEHTLSLFRRHGIDVLEFWTDVDDPTIVYYLVAYTDRAARDTAWEGFRNDPDWLAVKAATETDGPLVGQIEKRVMRRTEYSPGRLDR